VPANSPIWKGLPSGTLTELVGSGQLKYAERITYVQKFGGRYYDCLLFANSHPRGSTWYITLGVAANLFQVEDTTLDSEKGGKGNVTVNYVYLGSTPPEEFALTPFEINPKIEKHSYFAALTPDDIKAAKQAYNAATAAGSATMTSAIASKVNAVNIKALIDKWLRGQETYYLAGFKFQHTLYFTSAPNGDPGGYIQNPFGSFAAYVAGAGLSWLRQSDEVVWNNGLWKLTRTWIGGPAGQWDTDIYPTH
jgi:hypothetical protein